MIPLLGIGAWPAIVALFLYSLLPIVRNTHAGLVGIPQPIRESAEVLGLPPRKRLAWIELPMATPAILAGIKTAAVINVGTATLGALIGAGDTVNQSSLHPPGQPRVNSSGGHPRGPARPPGPRRFRIRRTPPHPPRSAAATMRCV
jgi:hypothetical protein